MSARSCLGCKWFTVTEKAENFCKKKRRKLEDLSAKLCQDFKPLHFRLTTEKESTSTSYIA
jgi:hypothetical protein